MAQVRSTGRASKAKKNVKLSGESDVIRATLVIHYKKKANRFTFRPSIFMTKDHPPPLVLKFKLATLFKYVV